MYHHFLYENYEISPHPYKIITTLFLKIINFKQTSISVDCNQIFCIFKLKKIGTWPRCTKRLTIDIIINDFLNYRIAI